MFNSTKTGITAIILNGQTIKPTRKDMGLKEISIAEKIPYRSNNLYYTNPTALKG